MHWYFLLVLLVNEMCSMLKVINSLANEAPEGVKCGGHDGADFFLVNAFLKAVASGDRYGQIEDINDLFYFMT